MLAKQYRIQKQRDFDRIYKHSKYLNTNFFSIRFVTNKFKHPRFAVVISRKVSLLAVKRNKLKRQITSILQNIIKNNIKSYDMIFLVRKNILNANYQEIENDINIAIKKI